MRCLIALLCVAFCMRAQDEKDTVLGAALAARMRRESTLLAIPAAEQYARNVLSLLGSARQNTSPEAWQIQLIQEQRSDRQGVPTCEPIAFPPKYLFLPACLFLQAQNQAELAGMLAHAMAHLIEFRSRTHTPASATVPLIYSAGSMPSEIAADRMAVELMTSAGYDPTSLLTYLQRTQAPALRIASLKAKIADPFPVIQEEVRKTAELSAHRLPSLLHPDR